MAFDFDKEENFRSLLKSIYSPVKATREFKQTAFNHLLEASLDARMPIMFGPVVRICMPALALIALALIVYGYFAALVI